MKNVIAAIALTVSFIISAAPAGAHTLWLNASNHYPAFHEKFGAATRVFTGWGHQYPVDGFLEFSDLAAYDLVGPNAKVKELTPNPGGLLATDVRMAEPGVYFVSAVKKPGFYTMYEANGRLRHKSGPKSGLKNVVLSVYYEEYAKALLATGKVATDDLQKPVGHNLEIIPLKNPGNLKIGDSLPVKVLFEGAPAKFVQVLGTYYGFSSEDDFAFATKTNGKGEAAIRILHQGHWMLNSWKKMPAGPDYKDRCNQMSYSATLTFGIK